MVTEEEQDEVDEALASLVAKGMVIMTMGDDGQQHFEIAPAGVQALGVKLN